MNIKQDLHFHLAVFIPSIQFHRSALFRHLLPTARNAILIIQITLRGYYFWHNSTARFTIKPTTSIFRISRQFSALATFRKRFEYHRRVTTVLAISITVCTSSSFHLVIAGKYLLIFLPALFLSFLYCLSLSTDETFWVRWKSFKERCGVITFSRQYKPRLSSLTETIPLVLTFIIWSIRHSCFHFDSSFHITTLSTATLSR